MQFFAPNKGFVPGGGSVDKTSTPAPAINPLFNASAKSFSTIKGPLDVFKRNADAFIALRLYLLMMPSVCGVNGQCRLTTSASSKSCSFVTQRKLFRCD